MTFSSEMTLLQLFVRGICDKAHSVGHMGRDQLPTRQRRLSLPKAGLGGCRGPYIFLKAMSACGECELGVSSSNSVLGSELRQEQGLFCVSDPDKHSCFRQGLLSIRSHRELFF